jgi:4,5-dihydroxyphthalate decarboxylase
LRERGHYPINHLVVIKDELIEQHPELAADVFKAFSDSKLLYLERLKAGEIASPTGVDKLHQRVAEIIGDPLPYGIEPNRKVLEDLVQHALTQKIITRPVSVDELFAPATRALVG